jgi:murein DD-endopeptidase MepM/ murein hydrolase activator NlpD
MNHHLKVGILFCVVAVGPALGRDQRSADDALPSFSVSVEPPRVAQGGVLKVVARPLRDARLRELRAQLFGKNALGARWQRGELLALVPVPLERPTGSALLALEVEDEQSGVFRVGVPVTVVEGDFENDELDVGRRFTEPTRGQRRRAAQDARAFRKVWAGVRVTKVWRGAFILPREAAVTARFGTFRTLNQRLRSRHLGIDLGGRRGEPVHASNDGVVVLARDCFYSGQTVVIDHGRRVHSLYFHLSAMHVRMGDSVHRGQVIGDVGSTGRVTGPHLHFGIKLAGVYVNPEALLGLDLSGDPDSISVSPVVHVSRRRVGRDDPPQKPEEEWSHDGNSD